MQDRLHVIVPAYNPDIKERAEEDWLNLPGPGKERVGVGQMLLTKGVEVRTKAAFYSSVVSVRVGMRGQVGAVIAMGTRISQGFPPLFGEQALLSSMYLISE
jgi:hypothetical protein